MTQGPPLADPVTCGQDHARNLLRATELAARHCKGCEDYHATISLNRIVGASAWCGASRTSLANFIGKRLAGGIAPGDHFDVVIAGAADTSTLAVTAHEIAAAGPDYLSRTRFQVLDRCLTPLTLCQEFADRHGLDARIAPDDLLEPRNSYRADVVILHSVMNFVPVEAHEQVLASVMSWLKPDGVAYLWNALERPANAQEAAYRKENSARIRSMLADGQLAVGEDMAVFLQRLDRHSVKNGGGPQGHLPAAYFKDLLARMGATIRCFEVVDDVLAMPTGGELRRPFLEAVFGRP